MNTETPSPQPLIHILNLPKDKDVLEFIKKRLVNASTPERLEIISELFEMHRTSTGFDPLSLTKGRFKRIKAGDMRKILFEINSEIPSVINSNEYKDYLNSQDEEHEKILKKIKSLKAKIAKEGVACCDDQLDDLIKEISSHDQLLSAFLDLFKTYIKEKHEVSK